MSVRVHVRVDAFERIKADRDLRSNYALAKRLGVAPSTVGRVLKSEQLPGNEFIAATIATLGVDFDDVFEIERSEPDSENVDRKAGE
ncbi:helix-turn-helix domain-containing protein [Saccharothrix deserti]|uniref:helix-turn-helix domain-containing protein n=1 Tax=Saccharothrix deserti TaxID=2593674 RepID=UPI00131D6F2C|nr:helix-turn-helix transcriptional regulator [Saccharothrix deserti]